jgi:SET domain-containing protein
MPRKIVARRSAIHGNGVFAVRRSQGERVVEYKGRRRSHADIDAATAEMPTGHTFLFAQRRVRDRRQIWRHGALDQPQLRAPAEAVLKRPRGEQRDQRKDRVFIEAIRAIKPGEELSYNYGITLAEAHTARLKKIWECRCGAKDCTGTMLQPKRKSAKAK